MDEHADACAALRRTHAPRRLRAGLAHCAATGRVRARRDEHHTGEHSPRSRPPCDVPSAHPPPHTGRGKCLLPRHQASFTTGLPVFVVVSCARCGQRAGRLTRLLPYALLLAIATHWQVYNASFRGAGTHVAFIVSSGTLEQSQACGSQGARMLCTSGPRGVGWLKYATWSPQAAGTVTLAAVRPALQLNATVLAPRPPALAAGTPSDSQA